MYTFNKREPHHWQPIRDKRNKYLDITDKYIVPDRLTPEQYTQLVAYRAALRDLTNQCQAASQVVFPTPPSFVKELQN